LLASVVLGAVGFMLSILPILAIPISGCGLILGACGLAAASRGKTVDLQLSIVGAAACSASLAVAVVINFAPGGYFRFPADVPRTSPLRRGPFIAPPAPFEAIHFSHRDTAYA